MLDRCGPVGAVDAQEVPLGLPDAWEALPLKLDLEGLLAVLCRDIFPVEGVRREEVNPPRVALRPGNRTPNGFPMGLGRLETTPPPIIFCTTAFAPRYRLSEKSHEYA